jgi:hypothetical protein
VSHILLFAGRHSCVAGTRRTRFAGDLLDSVLESVLLQHAQSASAASSTSNDIPLLTPKFLLKKTYDDQLHRFNVASLSFPGTRDSFTRFMKMVYLSRLWSTLHLISRMLMFSQDLVRDIKENVCRASEYAVDARAEMSSWPGVAYELPDGRTIDIGGDRFAVSELMFQPTFLDVSSFVRFPMFRASLFYQHSIFFYLTFTDEQRH